MMLPRHTYRSQNVTPAEMRMAHEHDSPEVQRTKELLQNPAVQLDQLEDAIRKGRNTQTQSGEFLDTVARELKKENPDVINQNLDKLAKRATDEKLDALKSTIDQIRNRMDTAPESALQPVNGPEVQTSAATEQPSFLNRVGTGIGNTAETISNTVLPKSLSEHMTRGQKIAAGTALTLGAGVVLWQLGKMLFGRGKNAAEAGKEAAANSKGGFLKKLLIGGLVVAGVFFGAKALFRNTDKDPSSNGDTKKKSNPIVDYIWNNLVPDEAKPYLEAGQNALVVKNGCKTMLKSYWAE
jgi:hypothetical protein